MRRCWLQLALVPLLACSTPTTHSDAPLAPSAAATVEREPDLHPANDGRCPTLIPHANGPTVGRGRPGPLPQHLDATVEQLHVDRVGDYMAFDGDCDGELEIVLLTESSVGRQLWWIDRDVAIDLGADAGVERVDRAVPQLLADGTPIVVLLDSPDAVYGRIIDASFVVLGRIEPPADLQCEHRGIGVAQRQDGRFAYFHRPTGGPAGSVCEHEMVVIDPATLTAAPGEPTPGDPHFEVLSSVPGPADAAHALDLARCDHEQVVEQPPFDMWSCGEAQLGVVELELDTLTADQVIDGSAREIDSHPGERAVVERTLAAPELEGLGPVDRVALVRVFVDDVPVRLKWLVITPRPAGASGLRVLECSHEVVGSIWDTRLMASSRAMCLATIAAHLSQHP